MIHIISHALFYILICNLILSETLFKYERICNLVIVFRLTDMQSTFNVNVFMSIRTFYFSDILFSERNIHESILFYNVLQRSST